MVVVVVDLGERYFWDAKGGERFMDVVGGIGWVEKTKQIWIIIREFKYPAALFKFVTLLFTHSLTLQLVFKVRSRQ